MKQIDQMNRDQIQMTSLNMMVDENSLVRVLDHFIRWATEHQLGFKQSNRITGRPSFPTKTLLGIYMYGYLHKIRSSRGLEKACKVNVELMWLVKGQKPCYKTIANFRKDNQKGFRNLFKLYRDFCIRLGLYGKEVVAIDGSKFRAQNSMKNNFNNKKIDRQIAYIESKEQEYLNTLDIEDKNKVLCQPSSEDRLSELAERKQKYLNLKTQLENSDETQISTTDPDARALPLKMNIVEVAYNLQSAVDDKHNLIVDYKITNRNDARALAPMALSAKEALGLTKEDGFTVLADKGYHTGEQMQACHDNNIDTIVAIPRRPKQTDKSKPVHLRKENFAHNDEEQSYTCPNGETLTKQATYQRKDRTGRMAQKFDRYSIKYSICKECEYFNQCVSKGNQSRGQGRYIDRYHTDPAVKRNKEHVNSNKALYKRRQAIVEHPFGTIKRQWGFSYTVMKTLPKVKTEFSIIMLCYNIRRTMSILGVEGLRNSLKWAVILFLGLTTTLKYHMLSKINCQHHYA